jgi:MoaA/NifB/PqqE/SkfB family radical SAM enzyme
MGAPSPFPTRWTEPTIIPFDPDTGEITPLDDDYRIDDDPSEDPYRLPEEHLRRYAVTWGVTHPCNLKCTHCYDVVSHKRTDLTTKQALEAVDRLAEAGISFIVFSGGEPLLRRDLFDLMARCQQHGIQFGIRSNATLITPETAERLADLRLAVAGVSLDGADATTHDAIRGAGTFARTQQGIAALTATGLRVNIEVVLSQRNRQQALDFVALAEDWGAQEVNFSTITPNGRGVHLAADKLDYAAWREVTSLLADASATARIAVSPACPLTGACWATIQPNITCDGWVTPCYLSGKKLFHILQAAPADFRTLLQAHRHATVDICGRRAWIQPTAQSAIPQ